MILAKRPRSDNLIFVDPLVLWGNPTQFNCIIHVKSDDNKQFFQQNQVKIIGIILFLKFNLNSTNFEISRYNEFLRNGNSVSCFQKSSICYCFPSTTILIKVSPGTFESLLLFWNSRATFHSLLIGRELFSSRASYVNQQQMALPLSLQFSWLAFETIIRLDIFKYSFVSSITSLSFYINH